MVGVKPTLSGCFYILGSCCFIIHQPPIFGGSCFIIGTIFGWVPVQGETFSDRAWWQLSEVGAGLFAVTLEATFHLPWVGRRTKAWATQWVKGRRA